MNYSAVTFDDMANGEGVRTVIWVSGCTVGCEECHNKELQDFNHGGEFTDDTLLEVIQHTLKPWVSGVTLTGGHPLEEKNLDEVLHIVKTLSERVPGKTIWLYTGYVWEDIIKNKKILEILGYCDVVVDGMYKKELRDITLKFRGSSNQRLIKSKQSLKEGKVITLDE